MAVVTQNAITPLEMKFTMLWILLLNRAEHLPYPLLLSALTTFFLYRLQVCIKVFNLLQRIQCNAFVCGGYMTHAPSRILPC